MRSRHHSWLCIVILLGAAPLASAAWSQRLELRDYLEEYVFPEQLVSFQLTFPPGTGTRHLRLREEGQGRDLPYQLTEVGAAHARLHFRAGLKLGERRVFTVTSDAGYAPRFAAGVKLRDADPRRRTVVIDAGTQQVEVPHGEYAPGTRLSDVLPPLVRVGREAGRWAAQGRFTGDVRVERVRGEVLEEGPLRVRYRVEYRLQGGGRYEVVLTAQAGERYVTVEETLAGIRHADGLGFELSYREGVAPDARIAMANNGAYLERSGKYGAGVKEGKLPY